MSEDAIIGKLVKQFLDNRRSIACMDQTLREMGENLAAWGGALQNNPGGIEIKENGFHIGGQAHRVHNRDVDITIVELTTLLTDRQEAMRRQVRMAETLREMGLSDLVS